MPALERFCGTQLAPFASMTWTLWFSSGAFLLLWALGMAGTYLASPKTHVLLVLSVALLTGAITWRRIPPIR
jgi:hypothetical protein